MKIRNLLRSNEKLVRLLILGFALLAVILLITIGIHDLLSTKVPSLTNYQTLNINISAIGIVVSSLLTFAIFIVYWRLTNLEKIDKRPEIQVGEYDIVGNTAVIWLSNYGKGSALDLELEWEIVEPEKFPTEVESRKVPLQRKSDEGFRRETAIPPEEEFVMTQATPRIRIWDEDGYFIYPSWSSAVKRLASLEIEDIKFNLIVHYSNQLGEMDSVLVTPAGRGADILPGSSFQESVHGVPLEVTDPREITIDTATSPGLETIIKRGLLGEGSREILRAIESSSDGLPNSEIGVFSDEELQKRVCENLVTWGLLEVEEQNKSVNHFGEKERPPLFTITNTGGKYLEKT